MVNLSSVLAYKLTPTAMHSFFHFLLLLFMCILSNILCMILVFVLCLCVSDGRTDEGGGTSQGRAEK